MSAIGAKLAIRLMAIVTVLALVGGAASFGYANWKALELRVETAERGRAIADDEKDKAKAQSRLQEVASDEAEKTHASERRTRAAAEQARTEVANAEDFAALDLAIRAGVERVWNAAGYTVAPGAAPRDPGAGGTSGAVPEPGAAANDRAGFNA